MGFPFDYALYRSLYIHLIKYIKGYTDKNNIYL